MAEIGQRVGAMQSADKDEVRMYGFGIFVGNESPVEAAGMMAKIIREQGRTNPKILLDSGKVVYGCECWWGPEASVRAKIGDRRIVDVDIDEARLR